METIFIEVITPISFFILIKIVLFNFANRVIRLPDASLLNFSLLSEETTHSRSMLSAGMEKKASF